jgi:DNA end-binding protein Ku
MARPIWTGAISFGLVTIPVKLLPAVRADEDVHFHYLHAKDKGRLKTIRRCEVCGKDIPWDQTVRGFEYEKGAYVVVEEEELKAMRPEATQAVEILAFVGRDEIDPMLFDVPYYLAPEKKGRHAYALLRDVLTTNGKVGIAQVILRTRAHLAALAPRGDALIVELLRYPHEIIAASELDLPSAKERASAGEKKAAQMLIDAMTTEFDPRKYADDYEQKLRAALEARGRGEAPKRAKTKAPVATNVVDLVEILQRSLAKQSAKSTKSAKSGRRATKVAKAG